MPISKVVKSLTCCVLSISLLRAQTNFNPPRGPELGLSIVSVKPSRPDAGSASYRTTLDGIVIENNPLENTISIAYNIRDPRALTGLPSWVIHERFDILAKIEESNRDDFRKLTPEDKAKLLRQVLTERFGMKSHIETREFPVWALVVAKGGPKLKLATGKTEAGEKLTWQITGRYKLDAKNGSMENLCHMLLSTEAQEYTVDETHLDGLYDFTLTWTRPNQEGTYDAPEIFAAVKEQLGLELVKRKVAEPVMVVDEIHRPTPN